MFVNPKKEVSIELKISSLMSLKIFTFFTRIFRYSWCRMPQIIPSLELQSFLLSIVKTIEFSAWFHGENYAEYFATYFIPRKKKVSHYGGRRDLSFT